MRPVAGLAWVPASHMGCRGFTGADREPHARFLDCTSTGQRQEGPGFCGCLPQTPQIVLWGVQTQLLEDKRSRSTGLWARGDAEGRSPPGHDWNLLERFHETEPVTRYQGLRFADVQLPFFSQERESHL